MTVTVTVNVGLNPLDEGHEAAALAAGWQASSLRALKFETQYPYESVDDEFWNAPYLCHIFRIYAGAVTDENREPAACCDALATKVTKHENTVTE